MNVLFICEREYREGLIFELQEVPELLSLRGHNVYVIDYESRWQKLDALDLFSKRRSEIVSRVYPKSSVELLHTSFIKIPILSRVSAWFAYWQTIEEVIKYKDIDVIILYSVPTNGIQTLRIAQAYRIPVVFRSMDILHKLVKNPILSQITYLLEKRIYSEVDSVLVNSHMLKSYMVSMGVPSDKVKYLPIGIDTQRFTPCGGKQNEIVFVGTLYEFSGLDKFISRFPEILATVPDAKLTIVGDGEQRPILKKLINDLGLFRKVAITGYLSFSMVPAYINSATVCIVPFLENEITRDICPVKVLQYLSCGKPVVASRLAGLEAVINGEDQGIIYCNSMDDMVNRVIFLLKSPEQRNELGQSGRKYIEEYHDYNKIVSQFEREFLQLVQ